MMRVPLRVVRYVLIVAAGLVAVRAQPKLVPARIIDEPLWNYPLKAERAGIRRGEARAMVSVGEAGQLLDFLITGASHVAFAEALVEALPKMRFAPARWRGEPTVVRMPFVVYFRQEGTIASL